MANTAKKPRATKKATKADLEAKIAELEAKLSSLSAQISKPAEVKAPPPQPESEVAPAYSTVSSTKYTGDQYYATRQRLAYHPPDKQFRGGQVTVTVQEAPPKPAPAPEPEPQPEPKREKPQRMEERPAPRVKYTGDNYYRTRQRLAYHPADKQFLEPKPVTFEETPSAYEDEPPQPSSQTESPKSSSQSKSRSSWRAKGARAAEEYQGTA